MLVLYSHYYRWQVQASRLEICRDVRQAASAGGPHSRRAHPVVPFFFSSGLPRGVTADPRAAPPLFSRPAAQLAAKRAVGLAAQPAAQKDEIQDADVSRF